MNDTGGEPEDISIAVGIPTMNTAATIRETLESLVDQTRQPDRILVVDASTDETPEIIKEFAEQTDVIITLRNHPRQGAVSAAHDRRCVRC